MGKPTLQPLMTVMLVHKDIVYVKVRTVCHRTSGHSILLFCVSRWVYCCGAKENEFIWEFCGKMRRTEGSLSDMMGDLALRSRPLRMSKRDGDNIQHEAKKRVYVMRTGRDLEVDGAIEWLYGGLGWCKGIARVRGSRGTDRDSVRWITASGSNNGTD